MGYVSADIQHCIYIAKMCILIYFWRQNWRKQTIWWGSNKEMLLSGVTLEDSGTAVIVGDFCLILL